MGKNLFVIKNIPLVLLAAIFVTLTEIFLNKTLHISTASYMTMMSMLTPVIVIGLAFVFLGEIINLYQLIGGALIIISGILINRTNIHAA